MRKLILLNLFRLRWATPMYSGELEEFGHGGV